MRRRPLSCSNPAVAGPLALLASFQLTSGAGAAVSIVVLGALFLLWIYCLFLLVADTISVLAKILWFVFLTCVAPIAIPLYLILRHRRHRRADASPA
jgi:hypothetical protein